MTSAILSAAGGIGLFLLGMTIMTGALKALAGDSLRKVLARFTHSPFSGAMTGAGVTAVIQSSSATTVMAIGFVGAGLLTFSQALGIIFGANLGTTVTGWFVAILGFKLKLGEAALPLVFLGVLAHLFTKRKLSQTGLAVAGFGVIFVGIGTLQQGMAGLEGTVTPNSFPPDTLPGRLLLVLIGLVITLLTQSSSAGVATALAALNAGSISFEQAAAMVIGMNIGTTITAMVASIGGSTDARRTALAHVVFNLLTGLGAFLLLTPYTWGLNRLLPGAIANNAEIALVAFHTLFNALGMFVAVPFTGSFARLIKWLIPDSKVKYTERLDPALYETPALAIEAVRATLKELAQAVFELTDEILAPANVASAPQRGREADEGLELTRAYLEQLNPPVDQAQTRASYLACLHALDHLRRLIDRCDEWDRARRAQHDPRLASFAKSLRAALSQVLRRQNGTIWEPTSAGLEEVWHQIDADDEGVRNAIIEEAASRQVSPAEVIGSLDSLRWLRRVSYHLWRIAHHLQQGQLDTQPGEEDIPSYRDPEPEDPQPE